MRDTIFGAGGRPVVNRVGHAFFKARMREEKAAFGGEVSGHYYFRDFWSADSGVIPALLVLELSRYASRRCRSCSSPTASATSSRARSTRPSTIRRERCSELAELFSDGEVSWLDGVSVDYDTWHFNVRPSNTEPLLRLNLEGSTKEETEARTEDVLRVIRS